MTVVVPVRNGEAVVGACIESLLAQRYPTTRYEVIIVDNGSTDATPRRVADYPVRLVHCPVLGPSAARNAGVRRSEAELVAFTDVDCIAHPDWLLELGAAFEDDAVGGAGGPIEAFRYPTRGIVERFGDDFPPLRNYRSGAGEHLPHLYGANASYRRQLLLDVGGWDEQLLAAEDVELSWRLQLQTGAVIAYQPGALVHHRHRATYRSLAGQYWIYGLGEVLLDSLFRGQKAYPRRARFYSGRMARQIAALPRYVASGSVRGLRRIRGRATDYEAAVPWLWLTIEASNVAGKLQGLRLTRGLRNPEPLRRYLQRTVPMLYLPTRQPTPAVSLD